MFYMLYMRCLGDCLKGRVKGNSNLQNHVMELTRHMDTRLQQGKSGPGHLVSAKSIWMYSTWHMRVVWSIG